MCTGDEESIWNGSRKRRQERAGRTSNMQKAVANVESVLWQLWLIEEKNCNKKRKLQFRGDIKEESPGMKMFTKSQNWIGSFAEHPNLNFWGPQTMRFKQIAALR